MHRVSAFAQSAKGLRAKLFNQKRYKEKAALKKTLAVHDEKDVEHGDGAPPKGAVPAYLLDREGATRAKVLSNTVKQKRKEKAGKWAVPLPRVKPVTDDEMFKRCDGGGGRSMGVCRCVQRAACGRARSGAPAPHADGGLVASPPNAPRAPTTSRHCDTQPTHRRTHSLPAASSRARSATRRGSAW